MRPVLPFLGSFSIAAGGTVAHRPASRTWRAAGWTGRWTGRLSRSADRLSLRVIRPEAAQDGGHETRDRWRL